MAEWKISGMRHSEWEMEVVLALAPTQLFYTKKIARDSTTITKKAEIRWCGSRLLLKEVQYALILGGDNFDHCEVARGLGCL